MRSMKSNNLPQDIKSIKSGRPPSFGMSHRTMEQFTKTISFRGADGADDTQYQEILEKFNEHRQNKPKENTSTLLTVKRKKSNKLVIGNLAFLDQHAQDEFVKRQKKRKSIRKAKRKSFFRTNSWSGDTQNQFDNNNLNNQHVPQQVVVNNDNDNDNNDSTDNIDILDADQLSALSATSLD